MHLCVRHGLTVNALCLSSCSWARPIYDDCIIGLLWWLLRENKTLISLFLSCQLQRLPFCVCLLKFWSCYLQQHHSWVPEIVGLVTSDHLVAKIACFTNWDVIRLEQYLSLTSNIVSFQSANMQYCPCDGPIAATQNPLLIIRVISAKQSWSNIHQICHIYSVLDCKKKV